VINFGVSGYGPDQALLKLKRMYPKNPTPIVMMGYFSENISRIVNTYRFAYNLQRTGSFLHDGKPYFAPTKPRFVLEDGKLHLIPNPVQSEDDLIKWVYEPGYADRYSQQDYFREGYDTDNFNPQVSFPYLLSLGRAATRRLAHSQPPADYSLLLMQDAEAFRLLASIFDEFENYGTRSGFTGVVVLFGDINDLSQYIEYGEHKKIAPLLAYLQQKGYPFIDTIEILAAHYKSLSVKEPLELYYNESSHHSAYAHRIIADGMAKWIESNAKLRTLLDQANSKL
jgi:hypothetical protein